MDGFLYIAIYALIEFREKRIALLRISESDIVLLDVFRCIEKNVNHT